MSVIDTCAGGTRDALDDDDDDDDGAGTVASASSSGTRTDAAVEARGGGAVVVGGAFAAVPHPPIATSASATDARRASFDTMTSLYDVACAALPRW
jgi:hypothetical protein